MKRNDLTNKTFGRLFIISYSHTKNGMAYWNCKCKCGVKCIKNGSYILAKKTQSCGCQVKENFNHFKHGYARHRKETKFYMIWSRMLRRCRNKNSGDFSHYGAKGIFVCKEWFDFKNFLNDMHPSFVDHQKKIKKNEKSTIDRIDNNKGYSKENCRWATMKEQAVNRRTTIFISYNNKKMCLKDFSKTIGWQYHKIYRLHKKNKLSNFFNKTFFYIS